jgi:membrane protein implicated in regulation of membrane protease activity
MVGQIVSALTPIDAAGEKVFLEGEYWNATSDIPLDRRQLVQISAVEALTVKCCLKLNKPIACSKTSQN